MNGMNRRDVCVNAGVFAFFGGLLSAGQDSNQNNAQTPSSTDSVDTSKSHVFRFNHMVAQPQPPGTPSELIGIQRRRVMHGTLPTGEFVEVHQTTVPAGKMPHLPHKHRDSEFVLIREGEMEYWGEDGKRQPMVPGDIVFAASNQPHGWKNTGDKSATYFVVTVSHGQM